WGQTHYQEPARFFEEIPERFFEQVKVQPAHGYSSHYDDDDDDIDDGYRKRSKRNVGVHTDYSEGNDFVGQKIDHPEYGMGTIIAMDGTDEDRKVTVEFRGRV